jgi:outer membrane protein OmpA-like peptidoglycan-associated protein/tetratricopeptide (TPR) repeat protein
VTIQKNKNKRMKKIQLFILLAFATLSVNAQSAADLIKKADDAARSFDFTKAINSYTQALAINPDDNSVKEKLANLYLAPGNEKNQNLATKLYSELFYSGSLSPISQSRYANLLQTQGDFEKAASVYYNISNKGISSNSFIKNNNTSYYAKIAEDNSSISVKNVEAVNTKNSDFSPVYYRDGMAFVSTRKNRNKTGFKSNDEIVENFTDLFKAKSIASKPLGFDEPVMLLKASNQNYMHGAMYITRSITKNEKSVKSTADKNTVLMEICKVNYTVGDVENWSEITPIVLNRGENYQNYSYAHPAFVNGRGDEMIFASNMPGGFGGTDLWYSKLVGTEWSTPVNLGSEINTPGEEMFPFVAKDGTLYFASSGLPGLGGLDLFKAKNSGNVKYNSIENLGAPFNTKFDDFGFVTNNTGREGYFTSNRTGGKGLDDIYSWSTQDAQLCIKVYDAATKDPIANASVKIPCLGNQKYNTGKDGIICVTVTQLKNCDLAASFDGYKSNTLNVKSVTSNRVIEIPLEKDLEDRCKFVVIVLDKDTKQPISDAKITVRQTTNNEEVVGITKSDGSVRVKGISMNEFYDVSATKDINLDEKYIGLPESMICKGLRNGDSVVKYIYLQRAKKGTKFKIENIYYDLNKWFIRPEAAKELDKIVSLLGQYPTMEIEMGSHTDCRSSIKYNEDLSAKRAASAVEYITSKGISPSRLSSKGYGESELTNGCACEGTKKSTCSELEHQANRRTEFKILKF